MANVTNLHRADASSLLLPASPRSTLNLTESQAAVAATEPQQQWLHLSANDNYSDSCRDRDVAIAMLDGEGWLTLAEEVVALESGMVVLIPAHQPYRLQTASRLGCLLIRGESDGVLNAAWAVKF
jgi:mannose-6-phosphate isomerase class I